jgi:hypothetical protein
LMCFACVNLLSRSVPRYFTLFFWAWSTLPICTVEQVWLCRVNVICVDQMHSFYYVISKFGVGLTCFRILQETTACSPP